MKVCSGDQGHVPMMAGTPIYGKYRNQRRSMLTRISDLCFPGLNNNMVVTIMPDHLYYILLEGSSDLRLERLQESLRVSFRLY